MEKIDEYFNNFYKFCFDISPKYMIKEIKTLILNMAVPKKRHLLQKNRRFIINYLQ